MAGDWPEAPDGTLEVLGYRRRIAALARTLLAPYGPFERALDFGAGDGRFARQFTACGLMRNVIPIETVARATPQVVSLLYDGSLLPFADGAFDISYAIDVFHHCPDPESRIRDVLRCTHQFFLVKDHTHQTRAGRLALCLMDEIGNRPHGIQSPHNYQRGWEWSETIESAGFKLVERIHPARCHPLPLALVTDPLHFLALWRRT